jgi:signal peptidase I
MTNILSEKHKGSKIFKKVKKYFSSKKAEAKVIEEEKDFIGEVKDFMKDLVIIVLLVLFIRTFLAMPFQINGQSMYSSYYDKEFIIVDRLSYRI